MFWMSSDSVLMPSSVSKIERSDQQFGRVRGLELTHGLERSLLFGLRTFGRQTLDDRQRAIRRTARHDLQRGKA